MCVCICVCVYAYIVGSDLRDEYVCVYVYVYACIVGSDLRDEPSRNRPLGALRLSCGGSRRRRRTCTHTYVYA